MVVFDVTAFAYLMAFITVYYTLLFVLSVLPPLPESSGTPSLFLFFVIPARNEELVINATLRSLMSLEAERLVILVMNDGSTDATSELARRFEGTGKVVVIDRDRAIAGHGKGAVLNHAYRAVNRLIASSDGVLGGRGPSDVVSA